MKNKFIPFARPSIGEKEVENAVECIRSGWLTTGKYCADFEQKFSEYLGGTVTSLAVNSCTSGLHLALEAVGVSDCDEVITVTHTFTATAEVIRYLGATPVLVDISLSDYCIDIESVRKSITPKTKAVIVVHFAGNSADLKALKELCGASNIKIIEDAAHALPTLCEGYLIGSLKYSDIAVFSFYANKTMTTGEGGMIVCKDDALIDRMKKMRLHGIDRDAFSRFRSEKPAWEYDIIAPGYKYNMTDIAAAIGLGQLDRLAEMREQRAHIAEAYFKRLRDYPIILPPMTSFASHSWHLFIIRAIPETSVTRDTLVKAFSSARIGTSIHYKPLHRHTYWKETFNLDARDYPNSERLFASSISLPIYPYLDEDCVERVAMVLDDVF